MHSNFHLRLKYNYHSTTVDSLSDNSLRSLSTSLLSCNCQSTSSPSTAPDKCLSGENTLHTAAPAAEAREATFCAIRANDSSHRHFCFIIQMYICFQISTVGWLSLYSHSALCLLDTSSWRFRGERAFSTSTRRDINKSRKQNYASTFSTLN